MPKQTIMASDPDLIPINGSMKGGKSSPNEAKTPFLIGVAGGTASGKVSVQPKAFPCQFLIRIDKYVQRFE